MSQNEIEGCKGTVFESSVIHEHVNNNCFICFNRISADSALNDSSRLNTSGDAINTESVQKFTRIFDACCRLFSIDLERHTRLAFDFHQESLPFCLQCNLNLMELVALYDQFESIRQKIGKLEIENKIKICDTEDKSSLISITDKDNLDRCQLFRHLATKDFNPTVRLEQIKVENDQRDRDRESFSEIDIKEESWIATDDEYDHDFWHEEIEKMERRKQDINTDMRMGLFASPGPNGKANADISDLKRDNMSKRRSYSCHNVDKIDPPRPISDDKWSYRGWTFTASDGSRKDFTCDKCGKVLGKKWMKGHVNEYHLRLRRKSRMSSKICSRKSPSFKIEKNQWFYQGLTYTAVDGGYKCDPCGKLCSANWIKGHLKQFHLGVKRDRRTSKRSKYEIGLKIGDNTWLYKNCKYSAVEDGLFKCDSCENGKMLTSTNVKQHIREFHAEIQVKDKEEEMNCPAIIKNSSCTIDPLSDHVVEEHGYISDSADFNFCKPEPNDNIGSDVDYSGRSHETFETRKSEPGPDHNPDDKIADDERRNADEEIHGDSATSQKNNNKVQRKHNTRSCSHLETNATHLRVSTRSRKGSSYISTKKEDGSDNTFGPQLNRDGKWNFQNITFSIDATDGRLTCDSCKKVVQKNWIKSHVNVYHLRIPREGRGERKVPVTKRIPIGYNKWSFKGFQYSVTEDGFFECDTCNNKKLFKRSGIYSHIKEIHVGLKRNRVRKTNREIIRYEKPLKIGENKWSYRGTEFTDENGLYRCCVCDNRSYSNKQNFLLHIRTNHPEEQLKTKYKCNVCGQSFTMKCFLNKHLQRKHSNVRNIQCDKCGYVFKSATALKQHRLRVHDQIRPYQCEYCGKSFFAAKDCRVHVLTHTKKIPFRCQYPGCSKSFVSNTSLRKHTVTTHDEDMMILP